MGSISFTDGEVVDALASDDGWSGEGLPALLYMAHFSKPEAEFAAADPVDRATITLSFDELEALIVDSRRLDLSTDDHSQPTADAPKASRQSVDEPTAGRSSSESDTVRVSQHDARYQNTEEREMALEQHLQELRGVKGYLASGALSFTGEVLASDTVDPNVDLSMVGATFNDIFRSAHDASRKIGLDACRETVISTTRGIIIMHCSGVESRVHFHVITVMTADGNHALAKMTMQKMEAPILAELG